MFRVNFHPTQPLFGKILQIPLNLKRKEGSSEGNILPGDSNHPGELYSLMESQV